jgi:hypothetical protein
MGKPAHMSQEGWDRVIAARNTYWEKVRRGEIPHPTKGKKYVKNIVKLAPVETKHLTEFVMNGANQKQPTPSPPETARPHRRTKSTTPTTTTVLDRVKIATLQLIEIDSVSLRELEDTLNSIPECDRLLLSLDQLMVRLDRLHNFTSYCRKIHSDALERLRAHRNLS